MRLRTLLALRLEGFLCVVRNRWVMISQIRMTVVTTLLAVICRDMRVTRS